MPYKHAGEIGDVWKHLPLCDILQIEKPKRYFETNAAYAYYILPAEPRKKFGVFHFGRNADEFDGANSSYIRLLMQNKLFEERNYYGSPGLALTLLQGEDTTFYFHDIENEPLLLIKECAERMKLEDRVYTRCGDSIAKFLNSDYLLGQNDFVFIDPYTPFDRNDTGQTFFDVFCKVSKSAAKTLLWYGFESLNEHSRMHDNINSFVKESGKVIYTYDIWLNVMEDNGSSVNPGVPGCGLAGVNLSEESLKLLTKYLALLDKIYNKARYQGTDISLKTLEECYHIT